VSKGETFRGEQRRAMGPQTGVEVLQLTSAEAIHHTLYFTQASMRADDNTVVFVSNRGGGGWDLYGATLSDGIVTRMTDTGDINPFSPATSSTDDRVFYTAGSQVRAVDGTTLTEEVLADFGDASLGGCDVNPDGTQVLTVKRGVGDDALVTVGTDGSGAKAFFDAPRDVGYAQFCPKEPHWVLYSSGINQRMWTVSTRGLKDRPIYLHDARQWITHESFLGAGDEVLFTRWPDALMAIRRNGDDPRVVSHVNAWHASSRADGSLIVADTTLPDVGIRLIDPNDLRDAPLCYPGATSQGARWGERTPEPGLVDETTYGPQWTHPHPAFSASGKWVTYTSDCTGMPQVYAVRVPDEPAWETRDAAPDAV
jgi:oligogalacturonide lyase